ncbi:hypothetical protein [Leptolyngbya sp. FACHB-261]|uniref:coiled-coil domain-containing protein n=1 Tax=Leptolyngbya sp. FACHB-261 TaxID=2692806 RepID=UPI00168394BA|nr:hypothetical protein [Leptolyngbya sp. FACHB-261]MBD2099304.1 hypothetical protein [Leptolyngbya sp. FACHB-261]
MEILGGLGNQKATSHERIAKTIEALRQKRLDIKDELEPRKPEKYRTLEKLQTKAKEFFAFLPLLQAQRDFERIEKILSELILYTKSGQPSETIIENMLEELSFKVARNSNKISPTRLSLVYRIQELLYSISQKEVSNLSKSELNKLNEDILNEIISQRDILSKEFNKLLREKHAKQQELEEYSENLKGLNQAIAELEAEILELREGIKQRAQSDRVKQGQINSLNSSLNESNRKLLELQDQKKSWINKENNLLQKIDQQNNEISQLTSQLKKYSRIRVLEGEYIGNLSNKNSKYHFNGRCPDWKMLVGEYVLKLDDSREILSSSNPTIFLREGLGECEVCSGKRNSRRRIP